MEHFVIIKPTHRGLWYADGVLIRVLDPGRYEVPRPRPGRWGFHREPEVEVVLVDVRERELTIKGQEILTADKVAIRVSIVVQFRVTDPVAALHEVVNFEERLYSDVQLAARRSLASMTLEDILTNRTRLSDDILKDVKGAASGYGVTILRADVKDLVFPGNLQEIMNKVLATERLSQAQLVEARTRAEVQRIEAQAKTEAERFNFQFRMDAQKLEAAARAESAKLAAQSEAEIQGLKTEAEVKALLERELAAKAYTTHPALLRLQELETLRELSRTATARLYIGFDKHTSVDGHEEKE
jgi:regulator of protease activity HflC (stomatin/prohibitin superfamily)